MGFFKNIGAVVKECDWPHLRDNYITEGDILKIKNPGNWTPDDSSSSDDTYMYVTPVPRSGNICKGCVFAEMSYCMDCRAEFRKDGKDVQFREIQYSE